MPQVDTKRAPQTPTGPGEVSPIGSTHRAGSRRRAQRSATYREELRRIAPYEGIARIVIARRQTLGLTQRELAELVGTSHSVISRIESGQYPTSVTTLRRLADAFGTNLLVGFGDQPEGIDNAELVAISHPSDTAHGLTSALPDAATRGLRVLFCGSAPGVGSAGVSYDRAGNEFWPVLHRCGLTPERLAPDEYGRVLDYGIGLADVETTESTSDQTITNTWTEEAPLAELLERYRPWALAFNGKKAARAVLHRDVDYGPQPELIAGARVFVLPSTSAAARRFWDEQHWIELARACGPQDDVQGMMPTAIDGDT